MALQIGCRIIFYAYETTIPYIRSCIARQRHDIRHEYHTVESWNDILLLANEVLDDDLFVVITARRASVSFDPEYEKLPVFLTQYFANNNLLVIYPEQFGEVAVAPTFTDPLSQAVETSSHGLLGLRDGIDKLINWKKRITHRNRKKKIDI